MNPAVHYEKHEDLTPKCFGSDDEDNEEWDDEDNEEWDDEDDEEWDDEDDEEWDDED